MNAELTEFMQRVDPEILESMSEVENFEAVVQMIYDDAQKTLGEITAPDGGCNMEMIAYLFAMQSQAVNKLVDELEELRPAIRFITSVLLGNTDAEVEDA